MDASSALPLLVAVVGPTASGKSALGVFLARAFAGEVVACDSTQLYRGFDIGTAKPARGERGGVPHHLLDVLDPAEPATAGGYRERALAVLAGLRAAGRLPVLTVGTGLYLRALVEGLAELPQRSEELRERLRAAGRAAGPGHLHRMLVRFDPAAAKVIAPADEQKLIRAIEVCLLARRPVSELHRAGRKPLEGWRVLKIGLAPPRDRLHERIHARTEGMLRAGWLEEVRRLMASGLPEDAKPFGFIGYRELRALARGETSLQAAREAIERGTRQYAKRQLTWFRREPDLQWLAGFGDAPEIQAAARELVGARL